MDKLKEMLDGLVAEKSLSFEVLEQLRKVKTESEELTRINSELEDRNKNNLNLILEKTTQIGKLTEDIKLWKEREDSLTLREKAVLNIEHKNELEKLKASYAEATKAEIKEIVSIVFRNTTIRETVNKSVGHVVTPPGTSYPTTMTSSDREDKVTENV